MNKLILILTAACGTLSLHSIDTPSPAKEISISKTHPVIILGGGVGALTSAIYLQRAGIQAVVIEGPAPGGNIVQSPLVQNWPGELEISGHSLVEKIRNQAIANGAIILSQEVVQVDFSSYPYKIVIKDLVQHKLSEIETYSCIIALGATPNLLHVPGEFGEKGYWGKGVYNCVTCDGFLFKDKTVAVVGGGDSALIEAEYLSHIAKQVYVIVKNEDFKTVEAQRKTELLNSPNVRVLYQTKVEEITGDGSHVTHLVALNSKTNARERIPVDGIFIAIGSSPNSSLFKGQLELDEKGFIVLKEDQLTSKKGIYAIGDIVDPIYQQAISAAGDGAKAAIQVEKYLSSAQKMIKISDPKPLSITSETSGVIEWKGGQDFKQFLANSPNNIVVDFYSPYCGPCKRLSPHFEEAASRYQGQFTFVKVSVDKFSDFIDEYQIEGVPTVMLFSPQGSILQKKSGDSDAIQMLQHLERFSK